MDVAGVAPLCVAGGEATTIAPETLRQRGPTRS